MSFLDPTVRCNSDCFWPYNTQGNLYMATSCTAFDSERQEEDKVCVYLKGKKQLCSWCCIVVCWGLGWFGQAAVLCVTLQTWSQQLTLDSPRCFCDWLLIMPAIYQEGTCFVISTKELFGLEATSQPALLCSLLKHLLKQQWVIGLKHCNTNSYFQYCKMQKDVVFIIPWHFLFFCLISCYCV